MLRAETVQGVLDLFPSPRYIEIGVEEGNTFRAVKATRKVGIDPNFLFDYRAEAERDNTAIFHQMPSDFYFGSIVRPDDVFDVAFIDGLHTFEQTLRDLTNVMRYMSPRGVIVIDDVTPNQYHSSLPNINDATEVRRALGIEDPSWMGDVYRLVFFINSFFQQYDYATGAETLGQLIMWPSPRTPARIGARTVAEIGAYQFDAVVKHRDVYRLTPYKEIIEQIRVS